MQCYKHKYGAVTVNVSENPVAFILEKKIPCIDFSIFLSDITRDFHSYYKRYITI